MRLRPDVLAAISGFFLTEAYLPCALATMHMPTFLKISWRSQTSWPVLVLLALVETWAQMDFSGTGVLSAIDLKRGLEAADFGMTRLQIHSVLAEADYDEEGCCNYSTFAKTAADLIYRILDSEAQMERRQNLMCEIVQVLRHR